MKKVFKKRHRDHEIWTILFGGVIVLAVIVCIVECIPFSAVDKPDVNSMSIRVSVAMNSVSDSTLMNAPEPVDEWTPDPAEVEALAKTLYRECRGVTSTTEQAAVVWCVLNRVDSAYYPDTVIEVLEQPKQFAYDADAPVWQSLADLATDVLTRYHREQMGDRNAGRVLPREYIYFTGDGVHNYFTAEWKSKNYWTWEMETPYEN